MRLLAFTCGWLTGSAAGFLEGATGEIRVPVPAFLVDHPKGKVLFDSGMHPDTQTDPRGRLGRLADLFEVEFRAGEEIDARLREACVDPAHVDFLVSSHLHFDHAGGFERIPDARLVVQKAEWEAGQDPDVAARNGFDRKDYDLGHDRLIVDGEQDLFGDGRVVVLPTHGHTPGHQSLQVRLDSGSVVLAADSCYFRETLENLRLPLFFHDREQMLESVRRLCRLRDRGARIFYGHDPELWRDVPQAPAGIS